MLLRAAGAARFEIPAGEWAPGDVSDPCAAGLLVLSGHLLRCLDLAGGTSAEPVGPGDVLRPWDDETLGGPLPASVRWIALSTARVAILDATELASAGLVRQLSSRVLRRARAQSALLALSHIPCLEPRLVALLWHLADRYGHVEPEGAVMPLRLTHEAIGCLVGARRPSVSRSMRQVVARGLVTPRPAGGWWLAGDAQAALDACGNPGDGARAARFPVGSATAG